MPGTARNFGGLSATEYSQHLLRLVYPSVNGSGQPAPEFLYVDFRNILANPANRATQLTAVCRQAFRQEVGCQPLIREQAGRLERSVEVVGSGSPGDHVLVDAVDQRAVQIDQERGHRRLAVVHQSSHVHNPRTR